jgi:hypothetical protein
MDQALTPTNTSEQDLQQLPQMISAWKAIQEETNTLKNQLREKKVRQKALEEVILRTMKNHNIGALDLKASNARLMYKKRQSKGSLNQKSLTEMLSEYMKSDEEAKKAVAFIDEKRGIKTMEVLSFEKL